MIELRVFTRRRMMITGVCAAVCATWHSPVSVRSQVRSLATTSPFCRSVLEQGRLMKPAVRSLSRRRNRRSVSCSYRQINLLENYRLSYSSPFYERKHFTRGDRLSRYGLTCFHAVMLVASFGPLHRTAAACLRTCFWRQALETKSASAAQEKVGRWGRSVCERV